MSAKPHFVSIVDPIRVLPSRIVISYSDMVAISVGKAVFIRYEPVDDDHHDDISHAKCVQGLRLGQLCSRGAVLRFASPKGGKQVFVVREFDPDTQTWTCSWPD